MKVLASPAFWTLSSATLLFAQMLLAFPSVTLMSASELDSVNGSVPNCYKKGPDESLCGGTSSCEEDDGDNCPMGVPCWLEIEWGNITRPTCEFWPKGWSFCDHYIPMLCFRSRPCTEAGCDGTCGEWNTVNEDSELFVTGVCPIY
ncbi:hypothetical protein Spa11_00690 [Botrimarina mediterranea]|uniref:WAP domain-containing protein n=1 Tax=Botrimarina mediterranea TaxID=2528022 RepID=A0A518K2A7_9BACT|nr:hypothetical protein Spa11_00690 [Botrimarina mediterranea]